MRTRYLGPGWDVAKVRGTRYNTGDGIQMALDIGAQWRITKDLRLTAGIYNLTDKKYWNWADVNAVSSAQSTVDAWTQPGRYARVTLVADF